MCHSMMAESETQLIQKLIRIICQRLFIKCCCVLMLASAAGVSSTKRCAHNGEAVKLISDLGDDAKDVTLYNENGSMIASWKEHTNEVEDMDPDFGGRIHMDNKRNIWILGVEKKDAGRYYIKFGIDDRLDIVLTVKEKLTEEQLQECPNNHLDFPKEGSETSPYMTKMQYSERLRKEISQDTTTAQRQKEVTEGMGHDTTTAQGKKDDTKDSCNSLTNGLLSALLFILIADKILTSIFSENYIRQGWITGKHWIQKRCCSLDMKHNLSQPHENTRVTIEESGLTEDQVQCWLNGHLDFIEKHCGKLVEDQIQKWLTFFPGPLLVKKYLESLTADQVQGWLDLHPGFMKKCHDGHENHCQSIASTLNELGITMKGTGIEDNQNQQVSTQTKIIVYETCSSENSDEDELHHQNITPTFDELGVTLTGTGTGREDNSQGSDECEIHHQDKPTVDELGITMTKTEIGRESSQRQWVSLQKKVITYETCSSSSSDSFRETSLSSMQSIHKDAKKADPAGDKADQKRDKAQTDSVENSGETMNEDPNSDDYNAPLLSKSSIP